MDIKEILANLLEKSYLPFAVGYPDGQFMLVNQAFCHLVGYPEQELLQMKVVDLTPQEWLQAEVEVMEELKRSGIPQRYEKEYIRRDGARIVVELLIHVIHGEDGQVQYYYATVSDITSRKRMEEALKKQQIELESLVQERTEQLQALVGQLQQEVAEREFAESELKKANAQVTNILESITDSFMTLDNQWRFIYINKAAERHWGICKENLLGKVIWEEFPILVGSAFEKNYILAKETQRSIHFEDYTPMNHKWVSVDVYPSKDGLSTYIADITEQKLAREARRLERERLYHLIDSIPALIYLQTADRQIRYANSRFKKVFGEPNQHKCFEIIHQREKPCINCPTSIVFASKKSYQWEPEIIQGRTYDVYESFFVDVDGTPLVLKAMMDVTERQQAEKEMARLDRLDLIGQMAAGIGHEIRNPMTTVRGFLQLMQRRGDFAQQTEYLDLMISELDRANAIITEYLSITKDKATTLMPQSLNQIIQAIYPLISADAIDKGKEIRMELDEIPELLLNDNEIRQLLLNLVRNGLEAIPDLGAVTLRTFINNEHVVLSVQDEGVGMSSEILEKIGTPFYTTKDTGTGLGLAVCYGIAARHQAKINIETGPKGTTFYILFKHPMNSATG